MLLIISGLFIWPAATASKPFSLAKSVVLPADPSVNQSFDPSIDESNNTIIGRSMQLFSSGLETINLLGKLIVISTKANFSFQDSIPNYIFRYMRHPHSFRTTIIQIANDVHDAFRQAHSSMNQIQLYMSMIPGHVKTSLQILVSASSRLLKRMLMPSLNNIDRIGHTCSKLVSDTHERFVSVMQFLGEVIEVTTVVKSVQSPRLIKAETDLNISRQMEKREQRSLGLILKKNYNSTQATVREAQAAFIQALEDIRQHWNSLIQFFSEISLLTRITTNDTLVPFVNRTREVVEIQDITEIERKFYIDLLKHQSFDIHRHTHILYIISRTYVDIFNQFMMDKLNGLATMSSVSSDAERYEMLQQLMKHTTMVQSKVEDLANERKATFQTVLQKYKDDLEKYLINRNGAW